MAAYLHRLTNVLPRARLADCAHCGPGVPIRPRTSNPDKPEWRCNHPGDRSRRGVRNPEDVRQQKIRYRKSTGKTTEKARKYGLSRAEYERMREEQGNKCAVCKEPPPDNRALPIDHCHKTGKVRGLLCNRCNLALGMFGDDIELLRSAVAYLTRCQGEVGQEVEQPGSR